MNLEKFESNWANKYALIGRSWRANWSRVIPLFAYPKDIRRVIYTTDTIESINYSLSKIIKNKALFPNDDAVFKILYLALRNIFKKWTMPIPNWGLAMNEWWCQ